MARGYFRGLPTDRAVAAARAGRPKPVPAVRRVIALSSSPTLHEVLRAAPEGAARGLVLRTIAPI